MTLRDRIKSILGPMASPSKLDQLEALVREYASRDLSQTAGSALEGASREVLFDKIEGLEAELFEAVRVAYFRGAVEWTKRNYPAWFERLKVGGGQPSSAKAAEREGSWDAL